MFVCVCVYVYMYTPMSIRKYIRIYKQVGLTTKKVLVGWFVGFYGISTSVGYFTPNPFLCK